MSKIPLSGKKVECTVYGLSWDETGQQCVSMSHKVKYTHNDTYISSKLILIPVSALKEALEKVENDPDYKEVVE